MMLPQNVRPQGGPEGAPGALTGSTGMWHTSTRAHQWVLVLDGAYRCIPCTACGWLAGGRMQPAAGLQRGARWATQSA